MRFQHDCDQCKPLGEFGDADLYCCQAQLGGPTVIARYSDEAATTKAAWRLPTSYRRDNATRERTQV